MNRRLFPLLEEINDNMITESKPGKFIYRRRLFEILNKHLRAQEKKLLEKSLI